jgi:hypothetical protein
MNALWALRGAHRHKDVEFLVQDLRSFHGATLSLRAARGAGSAHLQRPSRGKRLMQLARFVRTLGLLLMLGLAGSGGGCGLGSQAPSDQERQNQIRELKKTAHQQAEAKQQGAAMRKVARRARAGN